MPTRLVNFSTDAASSPVLARFWADLLGWRISFEADDEVDVCAPTDDGFAMDLVFVPVPEPKTMKNRTHLDLASTSTEHQAEIVRRAESLGARRIDIGQGDVPWIVLADPEGNEFCVLASRAP